jgi:hypothetical protein
LRNLQSPAAIDKSDFHSSGLSHEGLGTVPEHIGKHTPVNIQSKGYYKNQRSKTTIQSGSNKARHQLSINQSMEYRKKKFVKHDYLAKIRNKKLSNDGYKYKENDFYRDIIDNPNLSAIDKYYEIKAKTDDLERKAELKSDEEINSMYMDSIKAKAALLSNLL